MTNLFTFLAAVYFCCLIILLCTNKIVQRPKTFDLSRFDLGWKWYLHLENRWFISVNWLLVIFFILLAFAGKEWL